MLSDEAFKVFLQRYTLPVGADNPMVAGALRERAGRRKFNAFMTSALQIFQILVPRLAKGLFPVS